MRTLHLIALGHRGDVAPVLTLAGELRARGHDVLVHGATRYVALAEAAGVPYRGVVDVELLGTTPARRRMLLAQAGITFAWLRDRYRRWSRAVWRDLLAVAEPDDVLLCGLGSAALAHAWRRRGGRAALLLLADVLPTAGGLRDARRDLVWRLAQGMSHAPEPGRPPIVRAARAVGRTDRDVPLPIIVAASSTLSAHPEPAAPHVIRTGHLIAPAAQSTPPLALPTDRPLVYVGLGSLGDTGGRVLERLDAAAGRVGCRLVTDGPDDGGRTGLTGRANVVRVEPGDHRLLFPRMQGLLHHGGAGTAVTGLLAACPSGTIPYLGDQFEVGRRLHDLGAGPPPLRRLLLTPAALGRTLTLLADPPGSYRRAAAELAQRLAAEDGVRRTATACEVVHDGGLTFGAAT